MIESNRLQTQNISNILLKCLIPLRDPVRCNLLLQLQRLRTGTFFYISSSLDLFEFVALQLGFTTSNIRLRKLKQSYERPQSFSTMNFRYIHRTSSQSLQSNDAKTRGGTQTRESLKTNLISILNNSVQVWQTISLVGPKQR